MEKKGKKKKETRNKEKCWMKERNRVKNNWMRKKIMRKKYMERQDRPWKKERKKEKF